ncbi:MAG: hypothetical protein WBP41_03330 [Saprospiraceae bacterium]
MTSLFQSQYRNIFIVSLAIFLITAFFSEGYYHPDEHFQILEFCNYKLGFSSAADLPWEFHEEIRPALQPAIALATIKALLLFHIRNPFSWALFLRILSGLFAWFVMAKAILFFQKDFSTDQGKKIFLLLSFFLWFIPFNNVRFSSENFSGITFLLSIYFTLQSLEDTSKNKVAKLFIAGFLLGLAFIFRFQMGLAIMGLGLWLMIIRKIELKYLLLLIVSGLCSVLFCIYLDYWFYGKWVLTPLNYYTANIIENKAANWGIKPWWTYFNYFIIDPVPPISILLLIFFVIGLIKKSKHVLVWCLVPFILAHFLIGHKEIRFMFPMAFSFLFLAAQGIDSFISSGKYLKTGRIVFRICMFINIALLLIVMVRPAQEAICYYKFLYNYSSKKEITILSNEKDAYEVSGLRTNFYKSTHVNCIITKDTLAQIEYVNILKPDSILILERELYENIKFPGYTKESIYSIFPEWVLKNNYNNWQHRTRIWNIRKLKKMN